MAFRHYINAPGKHTFEGMLKIAGPTLVAEGEDYDQGPTNRYAVRVPRGVKAQDVARGLYASFNEIGRCGHSYDCCGCKHYIVKVRQIAPRKLSLILATRFNY